MKLTDLNPRYQDIIHLDKKLLSFSCPQCKVHRIEIPVHPEGRFGAWGITGTDFSNVTVMPSIEHDAPSQKCKSHFNITNGKIQMV